MAKMIVAEEQRLEDLDRMIEFIEDRGGLVRFDTYMQEHLYGADGFYSSRVKINSEGADFSTDSIFIEYAYLFYLYAQELGLDDKLFLELAGGEGDFKKRYTEVSNNIHNYISLDLSPLLTVKQTKPKGAGVILGNSFELPFQKESIDGIIFANELLDAFPCRTFQVEKNKNGEIVIALEAYINIEKGKVNAFLERPMKDDFLELYEEFLNTKEGQLGNDQIVSVSPAYPKIISEISRVLGMGAAILPDYGFIRDSRYVRIRNMFKQEIPWGQNRNNRKFDLKTVLKYPYSTDMSFRVDFDFVKWLAEREDKFSQIECIARHDVFKRLLRHNPHSELGRMYKRFKTIYYRPDINLTLVKEISPATFI